LRYRYKTESATSFSSWSTLLAKTTTTANEVDAILQNVVSSISTSYVMQLGVIDDIGESASAEFSIPTDQVAFHLKDGGKGAAFGKYAELDNCLDINEEWELNARGDMRIGKTLYPNHIAPIETYSYKDFNELVYNTGYYSGTSAPSSISATNYPINETGMLEVISTMTPSDATTSGWYGFAYQTYRTYTGLIYVRSYFSSSGWTAWKKVTLT
jgi:hypothetical protein